MKYLHLVWASLFRRKTRTILTLVSIIAAFLLFGLLDAVRTSFNQAGQSANGAQRLQTGSKLSFIQTLPQTLQAQMEALPGVKMVTYANWFGGAYQDPHNQVFSFAVPPSYLDAYPEMSVTAAERKAFNETRTGVLVGEGLMSRFKWKVGDRIPMQSTIFPDKSGSKNWTFDIVGVIHSTDKKSAGFYDQMMLLQWKYFDDTTPYNRGNVGWYVTRVTDVNQADRVAKAIDALSVNSDHETRTLTEQAATAALLQRERAGDGAGRVHLAAAHRRAGGHAHRQRAHSRGEPGQRRHAGAAAGGQGELDARHRTDGAHRRDGGRPARLERDAVEHRGCTGRTLKDETT